MLNFCGSMLNRGGHILASIKISSIGGAKVKTRHPCESRDPLKKSLDDCKHLLMSFIVNQYVSIIFLTKPFNSVVFIPLANEGGAFLRK